MTLERFVTAQEGVYEQALGELVAGRKRTHWIWFIFPQLQGLGRSEMARLYAIADLSEARAYAAHPLLGPRLQASGAALLTHGTRRADTILGHVDALKLRSSATLFALTEDAPLVTVMEDVLARFYFGEPCPRTLRLLERG